MYRSWKTMLHTYYFGLGLADVETFSIKVDPLSYQESIIEASVCIFAMILILIAPNVLLGIIMDAFNQVRLTFDDSSMQSTFISDVLLSTKLVAILRHAIFTTFMDEVKVFGPKWWQISPKNTYVFIAFQEPTEFKVDLETNEEVEVEGKVTIMNQDDYRRCVYFHGKEWGRFKDVVVEPFEVEEDQGTGKLRSPAAEMALNDLAGFTYEEYEEGKGLKEETVQVCTYSSTVVCPQLFALHCLPCSLN